MPRFLVFREGLFYADSAFFAAHLYGGQKEIHRRDAENAGHFCNPKTPDARPKATAPHDPKAYMGMAKIDVATGGRRVIYSQPQPANGSADNCRRPCVLRRSQPAFARSTRTAEGGMIVNRTISYAVNGRQYVMVYTSGAHSATAGPLGLTGKVIPPAAFGHNAIYVFALP